MGFLILLLGIAWEIYIFNDIYKNGYKTYLSTRDIIGGLCLIILGLIQICE